MPTNTATTSVLKEKTFTSFTAAQGANYAQYRKNYHPSVYKHIVSQHTSTSGKLDSLLDIGCGPGLATFKLAPHFTRTTGLDPSPAMITTAESLNPSPSSISFRASSAEDMSSVPDGSVDLITAANAAHWFDMPKFWREAARVVRPGGSVALWTTANSVPHPDTPNFEKVCAAVDRHREEYLRPFIAEGNLLTADGYARLPMPWDVEVRGFDRERFNRRVWGPEEVFTAEPENNSVEEFEGLMGTKSAVVRWREANPEKVGTEEDVVRVLRREVEDLLREAGVKDEDMVMKRWSPGTVLIVKRE